MVLSGHQGVVVSADWLAGGDQAVTASWERTAALWDISSDTMVQTLPGPSPTQQRTDSLIFDESLTF